MTSFFRVTSSSQETVQIQIREWETIECRLSSNALLDLAQVDSKTLRVQTTPFGTTRITATSHVGCLKLGCVNLAIQPKVPIPSLLSLIAEVHEVASLLPDLAGFEQSPEIIDLLVQAFLKQVDLLSQRGLKRSYVNCEDQLVAVRGRIDVRRTFALHLQAKPNVWCAYDEFTLDIPENRLLLSALLAITGNSALVPARRNLANRLTTDFAGVSEFRGGAESWNAITCDRLTSHYEPVLNLAKLILSSQGLANSFGAANSNGFLLNMNQLFELFIERRLRSMLRSQGIAVYGQKSFPFDTERQAEIRPDLIVQSRTGRRLAADAKYKNTNRPETGDLYQMLAYCRILKIPRGLLITVGKNYPRTLQVRDMETTIDVIPVDLGGNLDDVNRSLVSLYDWIRMVGLE